MKRKKGYFSISAVARMFSVHQQTIRLYEKEGLIAPKRSTGNTRMFSEEDVNRLEEIIYLTHKLKINLSGVEMILRLQKRIQKLQDEVNVLFRETQSQLDKENVEYKKEIKQQVEELQAIKEKKAIKAEEIEEAEKKTGKPSKNNPSSNNKQSKSDESIEIEDWEIDYNE